MVRRNVTFWTLVWLGLLLCVHPAIADAQTVDNCASEQPYPTELTWKETESFAISACVPVVTDAGWVVEVDGTLRREPSWRFEMNATPGAMGAFFAWTSPVSLPPGRHNVDVVLVRNDGKDTILTRLPKPIALTVTAAANPVDCVVSDWSPWSDWSAWAPISPTTEQRTHTRTRTVLTPATNGGSACPAQIETAAETRLMTADSCKGAVVLAVGSWTPTGFGGDSGRALIALTRSTEPVTEIWTYLDGVATPDTPAIPNPTRGPNLRGVPGVYFVLPDAVGTHKLTVVAKAANGCSDGATRPMTVEVLPR